MTETGMYQYQLESVNQLDSGKHLLALPYGTGKSWIALEQTVRHFLTRHLRHGSRGDRRTQEYCTVIICKNHNVATWHIEILRRTVCQMLSIFEGPEGLIRLITGPRPAERSPGPCILIFPYHRVRDYGLQLDRLVRQERCISLILDECTTVKNPKAQVTKAMIRLTTIVKAQGGLVLGLSGKPMPEHESDIWAQFQAIYPAQRNPFGTTYYQFLNHWFVKAAYGWVLNVRMRKKFYHLVRERVVGLSAEGLQEFEEELSTITRYTVEQYEESAEQRRLLDQLYSTWSLPVAASDTAEEYNYVIALQTKAQQISSGFYYTEGKRVTLLKHNPKAKLLCTVVKQLLSERPDRRIIVWRRFVVEDSIIACSLTANNITFGLGSYEQTRVKFSLPDSSQVLIMPLGTAQGLNELVAADINIFFSNVFSQEARSQAEARICRLGQKESSITHIDLCSPRLVDADIIAALQSKEFTPARLNTIVNAYTENFHG